MRQLRYSNSLLNVSKKYHLYSLYKSNLIIRRIRITGLTAHKPISNSVEEAVKPLVRLSKSNESFPVPEATLNALSRQVGAYVDELPGSFSNMRKFRNDILSMKKKHGQIYFLDANARNSVNQLVEEVNMHVCSDYCTKNRKYICKRRLPFKIINKTALKQIIDKNLNRSYRIYLRRNHPRINPYNLPIINVWRANMDITMLCGVLSLQSFMSLTIFQKLIKDLI